MKLNVVGGHFLIIACATAGLCGYDGSEDGGGGAGTPPAGTVVGAAGDKAKHV